MNFLSIYQLQYLVDQVATAIGEKQKFEATINRRLRWGARAYTVKWVYRRTSKKEIEFSRGKIIDWFADEADKQSGSPEQAAAYHKHKRETLILDTVHEIAHFKTELRYRKLVKKHGFLPEQYRHRYHAKRFKRIEQKLLEKLQPHRDRLMNLDLSKITPPPAKPKPTKQAIIEKKLEKVEKHMKLLETRLKRTTTLLKKWKKKRKYYLKQLSLFVYG